MARLKIQPKLVFLHGLLGDRRDWQTVVEQLGYFDCMSLDLPWHGEMKHIEVADFQQTCNYLAEEIIQRVGNAPYWLIGYSLGGRIALYYALRAEAAHGNLQGMILEGAHLGLRSEPEKQTRWLHDQHWAQRFANENISAVLEDWYCQPVFADLTATQRQALCIKRGLNDAVGIAQMLLATSLAKQPDLSGELRASQLPIYYFCGEQDRKFCQLAYLHQLKLTLIKDAGHNAHQANPSEFAAQLTALLTSFYANK